MRANRLFAVALVVTACAVGLSGCRWGSPKPPPVPLHWVDIKTRESWIELDDNGQGHVTNLQLATSTGADCASSAIREFSGDIAWKMTGDGEAQMVADGVKVTFRAKWSFGVVDWSKVYINSCTRDPDLDGWTTYVGGTGP